MFCFQEITVVAGDGKPVKIHLGGENELEDCRRQVILSFATNQPPDFVLFLWTVTDQVIS